jgi:hypothetical protein
MARFGKKLLSAFLEVTEGEDGVIGSHGRVEGAPRDDGAVRESGAVREGGGAREGGAARDEGATPPDDRFAGHFDKLLSEANIPGPDYYEFARMIAVMQGIPDEAARYNAAFAGLQVQGLNKQRLLDTAGEYLRVLTADAEQFQATVDASYQEKVRGKETEAEEKATRIQALSQEILQLQQRISALQVEIRAGKEKLAVGSRAYDAESKRRQQEISRDVEKINQYIH